MLSSRGKKTTQRPPSSGKRSSERRYFVATNLSGKLEEIPCPHNRCAKPICLGDRSNCTYSGEDSSPPSDKKISLSKPLDGILIQTLPLL